MTPRVGVAQFQMSQLSPMYIVLLSCPPVLLIPTCIYFSSLQEHKTRVETRQGTQVGSRPFPMQPHN